MNVLEQTHVESPLLDQLAAMHWLVNTGNPDDPGASARTSFREVLLEQELRAALLRLNPGPDGAPWLDDTRLAQAISALQRGHATSLLEANEHTTRLLVDGIDVEGLPNWDGGRAQRIRYIDFDHPTANTFRAISQFRVQEPGTQATKAIVPDIVLFVNGIPLVVIECKSPNLSAPLTEAIDQLQRYSNQRDDFDQDEGNEALFRTNAFLVATCGDEARAGTIGARAVHYQAWKDTSPVPTATVHAELGTKHMRGQELLAAGMLRPAHLLELLRSFTVFMTAEGRRYKAIARYQQFRAVHLATARLRTGKLRVPGGDPDRRGGIIWHTQGSGKSLTMVFLVRKMRCDPLLRSFKIVFVTDRKDLQAQLSASTELAGEPIRIARRVKDLPKLLASKGPAIVFAMIQKYQDLEGEAPAEDDDDVPLKPKGGGSKPALDVINDDPAILVLVDEAHRSHAESLHANLDAALPDSARIGFTGTPIIMGEKKKTRAIFGDYIDKYTLRQSEADGATVPIVYEGRTSDAAVADGGSLDGLFEDMFVDRSPAELEAIKRKYATQGDVMSAPKLIAAKATDILEHYVDNVLPNGFKAQVVAHSRMAALRYREAFVTAQAELVAEIDALGPALELDGDATAELPRRPRIVHRARRFRDLIAELEFAPIISADGNDPPEYAEWTDRMKADTRIERFKRPLVHADPGKRDRLGFLIVKSMLLTGFDAPIEQVLYLDRAMREAELLQAIARVNRTHGERKRVGLVVDYYGVARHLKEALDAYETDDVAGAMHSIAEELPKLRDQHQRLLALFDERGIAVSGVLSRRERELLAEQFRGWLHPAVAGSDLAARLGDGSHAAALRAVVALEGFLLAPVGEQGKDDYGQLHPRFVQSVRRLLDKRTPLADRDTFSQQLVLLVEPMCFKTLAMLEPVALDAMPKKKRGLGAALTVLAQRGRSRYTLTLTPEEFERREGWEARSSYENAIRDVVPFRLDAAHRAADVEPDLWHSTLATMLGLADHNLADFEKYPAPDDHAVSSDTDALEALRDDKLRAQMQVVLKDFLETLDTVLPRAEARPFLEDAKHFTALQERARRLYRGGERPIGREVGEKVRKLIDDHVISLGIDPKVPPIDILDAKFDAHIGRVPSARAKASEMEHALRHHIRMHEGEDPVHYQKLSERLEEILEAHEGRWEDIVDVLGPLFDVARGGRAADDSGLDPQTQLPFFDVMRKSAHAVLDEARMQRLRELTVEVVDHVRQEIALAGFWHKPQSIAQLRGSFVKLLDEDGLFDFDVLDKLADELVELSKRNHARLVG